jgi:son of sevenless
MLNNFSTLTSIISALGTAPIARLKRTWDQVAARTTAVLENQRKLMASTKNFGEYRDQLHAAQPPCIPFFGAFVSTHVKVNGRLTSLCSRRLFDGFDLH